MKDNFYYGDIDYHEIIEICDSIDAMHSSRCYRIRHDLEYCYKEIEKISEQCMILL